MWGGCQRPGWGYWYPCFDAGLLVDSEPFGQHGVSVLVSSLLLLWWWWRWSSLSEDELYHFLAFHWVGCWMVKVTYWKLRDLTLRNQIVLSIEYCWCFRNPAPPGMYTVYCKYLADTVPASFFRLVFLNRLVSLNRLVFFFGEPPDEKWWHISLSAWRTVMEEASQD